MSEQPQAAAAPVHDPTADIHVVKRGMAWRESVPPRPGFVYNLAWLVLKPSLYVIFRMRFLERQRIPADRPVILAGNHVSYMDPVMICIGSFRRRPVHFMGKIELFATPLTSFLMRGLGAFPVRRGAADRDAIATASHILERGGIVGIFPEGTRIRGGKTVAAPQDGAAFIALRTGAVIVPVGICGTESIHPTGTKGIRFPRLTAYYGEPIDPADFTEGSRKERLAAITAAVMAGIEDAKHNAVRHAKG
jgi:1-acyl-sn-glycerol-3-phosphate acyltransferase